MIVEVYKSDKKAVKTSTFLLQCAWLTWLKKIVGSTFLKVDSTHSNCNS